MSDQGFYTSRRDFLTGGLTLLSAAGTLPIFLGQTARALAATQTGRRGKSDAHRVLVVVQLAGGNDGLNTIVPYTNDFYHRNRPRLALGKDACRPLADGIGVPDAATGLKELFDAGRMSVVQGVGYPNPNRSHFTSMDIWHTADPELKAHEGWLGRYFDARCRGDDPAPDPVEGIALLEETPAALKGDRFSPLTFEDPDRLTWRGGRDDAEAREVFRKLNNIDGDLPATDRALEQFLQRAALKAQVGADQIRSAARGTRGRAGQLGRTLEMVARMIAADLPTQVYYVSMGGFDTHSGQQARHRRLIAEFSSAMKDFVDDLARDKLLDRVLVVTFSEFGRRVQENASGGTDHGEAAPMMLFGSRLRPGLHEKHPDLSRLHRGDLAYGVDFRRVYATVLREWLRADHKQILGGTFRPMPLLRV